MPPKKNPPSDTAAKPLDFVPIDIGKLRFDPSNPRIAELLPKRASQEEMKQLLMGGSFNARELIPSFMENGFLPYEPLIVREPDKKGVYVVVEGNRRLAALRTLEESKDPEESRIFQEKELGNVPCIIFHGTPLQELAYLGLRHLSKTKDWSATAKAAFVERVLRSGRTMSEAAKMTNTGSGTLRGLMLTRRLFERAGNLGFQLPKEDAEGEITFWHLGDAIRRTKTKQFLQVVENPNPLEQPEIDEGRLECLIGWLYGNPKTRTARVIQSIRDIPDLDSCLGNKRAIDSLVAGNSLADAMEELQAAGQSFLGHVDRSTRSLGRALMVIHDMDAASVPVANESVERLAVLLDQVRTLLQKRMTEGTK